MRLSIATVFLVAGVPGVQGCSGLFLSCPEPEPNAVRTEEVQQWLLDQRALEAGEQTLELCREICSFERGAIEDPTACTIEGVPSDTADTGTGLTLTCEGTFITYCEGGRRPPGLQPSRARSRLARAAAMEAASVPAFVRLHHELTLHGAPPELAARCLAAARDEARHAREVAALAGIPVPRPEVERRPVRDLDALALDNAVEGCVHETWAAVEAHIRATRGRRAHRAVWARIAMDETRHAQLAWDIDAWLAERGAVRPDARRRAGERLMRSVAPSRRALAARLGERLWA
ncbi:MAG: hypothetical protein V4850_32455 [Myxococcota bacterium]